MPVVDTEVLFALSPRDRKHAKVMGLLGSTEGLRVTDVGLLEFQMVLRARGRGLGEVREAILALDKALSDHGVTQVKTLDTALLALQGEIEAKYHLTYFDSLIAASALSLDDEIVSDDTAFDGISGLRRRALT